VRFKQEADAKKQKEDAASVATFMAHRQKVLAGRSKKRSLSIANVKQHEEYIHHLRNEYQRIRLEKNMDRLNKESIESAYRVDGLRRLKDESHTYVTPENIDDHIAMQLDPSRLIVPTIFYNRLGINDEVRYEMHKTVMQELQQMEANRRNLASIKRHFAFEEHLISDDMYPHVKVSHDYEEYLEERFNEATEIEEKQLAILDDPAFHQYIMSVPVEEAERIIDNLGTTEPFSKQGTGRFASLQSGAPSVSMRPKISSSSFGNLISKSSASPEADLESTAEALLASDIAAPVVGESEEGDDAFDIDRALSAGTTTTTTQQVAKQKPSAQASKEDIAALEKQIDQFMKSK
jgi:hypothetical protein